jgi:site-specific DNA recombinase
MKKSYKHLSLTSCPASSPVCSTQSFMKTAVIYARYSSSNQTEQSIEGQRHICEDFAKKHDIIIVGEYIDRAISGTTDNRDAFQKMLKDSNNKKWNYVLVYKLDRFARNKYEAAINRKHLKDNGIKLLSAMENIPETPEGVLLESLLEGMNQYFSEELAQKVKRGLHESRMKGHLIGAVSYGYIKENKMLRINEEEALIIKRIFNEYNSGKTILQITKIFEEENMTIKSNKFIPQTIRDILHRTMYTGKYTINGKEYNNIYPQIIDEKLFKEVNTKLNKNAYGCHKENHDVFKLKNKIYCGYCDRKMYPVSAISHNGKSLRYYSCYGTKKDNNCYTKNIDKQFVEQVVNKFLFYQFNELENLEYITNKVYELYKQKANNNNSINAIARDLKQVNLSLSNILSAIEKGITTETTKSRLEELEIQRKNLQEKLVIEQSRQTYILTKEEITNYLKYKLKESPIQAIEKYIQKVKVYKDKIEIQLNCISTTNTNTTIQKVFTETLLKERICKGGIIKTKTETYDIYVML